MKERQLDSVDFENIEARLKAKYYNFFLKLIISSIAILIGSGIYVYNQIIVSVEKTTKETLSSNKNISIIEKNKQDLLNFYEKEIINFKTEMVRKINNIENYPVDYSSNKMIFYNKNKKPLIIIWGNDSTNKIINFNYKFNNFPTVIANYSSNDLIDYIKIKNPIVPFSYQAVIQNKPLNSSLKLDVKLDKFVSISVPLDNRKFIGANNTKIPITWIAIGQ